VVFATYRETVQAQGCVHWCPCAISRREILVGRECPSHPGASPTSMECYMNHRLPDHRQLSGIHLCFALAS
jgi:hypothetical protein